TGKSSWWAPWRPTLDPRRPSTRGKATRMQSRRETTSGPPTRERDSPVLLDALTETDEHECRCDHDQDRNREREGVEARARVVCVAAHALPRIDDRRLERGVQSMARGGFRPGYVIHRAVGVRSTAKELAVVIERAHRSVVSRDRSIRRQD